MSALITEINMKLMKFCFLVLCLMIFSQSGYALKRDVISPFQKNIQDCVDKSINVKNINNSKQLFEAIKQFYPLLTSETLFREVQYLQKNMAKKLRYENGVIQIFKFEDPDDKAELVLSEKFGETTEDYQMRHKIRSVEARINQLLFRADITSDYQKIKETRAKGLALEINWADQQIKSIKIDFNESQKTLNCMQQDRVDICSCKSQ